MPTKLLAAIPKLASLNLEETLSFYEGLGFTRHGDHDSYGMISRDGVQIHFWLCRDPQIPNQTACRIAVSGIDSLFKAYEKKRVIHPNDSLALKPWGVWEFSILDPHGNCITFQQPE